ncbi:MAG: ring-cleaving dioxygenase [Acidimicrobiia bacterium]|nr:ring-cleaving dioxygenase [Acidimicrobiia bacterium]
MTTLVKGIHHITLCPGGAQEDVDFFTQVMAQRLCKQTVLMDGSIPIYHLYYGNADADVGSITTTFPYARKPGRSGSGQLSATTYTVPHGTTRFWADHFTSHGVEHSGIQERFGRKYVRVRHPAGLLFEVMEEPADTRNPWTTTRVSRDVGTRGFFGAVLSVRDVRDQEQFFIEALGFTKVGVDGPYHRFQAGDGIGGIIDLHHEPDRAPGSWGFGAGTAHHIALNLETDEALTQQKAKYEEIGFTDTSEIKDRFYFHSMYTRSPGGILVECTSNVPGGFYQDEAPEALGTTLLLPPWYEEQRAAIVARLEPITVPEQNRARGAAAKPAAPAQPAAAQPAVPLSRYKAKFDADTQAT